MSSNTTHEPSEWDDFLLGNDILEVCGSTVQWHFLNGLSRFTGILEIKNMEVNKEVCGHFILRLICKSAFKLLYHFNSEVCGNNSTFKLLYY